MPASILSLNWFFRSTPVCARELLGQRLCRRLPDGTVLRARITETESTLIGIRREGFP